MNIEDITLLEFVYKYALMVTDKQVLQYGLLLASGNSPAHSRALVWGVDGPNAQTLSAESELRRLGFLS